MTETSSSTEADVLVAEKRKLLAEQGKMHPGELAQALLKVSRAMQQAGRDNDALVTAEESVQVLRPAFLAKQAAAVETMREAVTQYVALAQRLRQKPDEALLLPIAQVLGDLTRNEDLAEDDGP